LGGLVEKDPQDKYGLAKNLIHPLLPWFREVNYHGPIQVTAVLHKDKWSVIEYNIRIGVTSGPMILRMLEDPAHMLLQVAQNKPLTLKFKEGVDCGCSLTLAGYGYPFVQTRGPRMPVEVSGAFDCDIWWNEVIRDESGRLMTTGHRIADVIALGGSMDQAIAKAYINIQRIRSLGSYFRPDVGQSLWPPGNL
jgi:phosphoribosylamine-glycine ligase